MVRSSVFIFLIPLTLIVIAETSLAQATKSLNVSPNVLSEAEVKQGWKLLFDGRTMNGWRGAYMDSLPAQGWKVQDGMLIVQAFGGGESAAGGDIVTREEYSNFDVRVDFKVTVNANSGIKYFVIEHQPRTPGSAKGLEYQILDDSTHPDAKLGINGNRALASLYDLIPATNKHVNPVGEWNTARIVVLGKHVEHWLNGEKVLEYELGSKEFLEHKEESKFKDLPWFGALERGHILLQEHGSVVYYRNLKIKQL